MRFGHALYRYLREILLADPALGPFYLINVDISDGFYHIALNLNDIQKLGVVSPTEKGATTVGRNTPGVTNGMEK